MIGFKKTESSKEEVPSEDFILEDRILSLRSKIEGKTLWFFRRGYLNQSYWYRVFIIENNIPEDITILLTGISPLVHCNNGGEINAAGEVELKEAFKNLSLLVYGKSAGFTSKWL